MKFGGSSVADADCIRRVAQRVYETSQDGHGVVVVVSAMGKTTDNLVKLAFDLNPKPNDREFDMLMSTGEQISVSLLAMALQSLGAEAVSMTGPQAGIYTDSSHTKAKITRIEPDRVQAALSKGKIVIVCGFQGLNEHRDISTLGRGGSDLTAVAMAGALNADRCQIFTDVEGIYTTDPRIVPEARKLSEIAYDEMLELASLGAKVLQSRSVEFASKYGVEIEVLSSFVKAPGTVVKEEVESMEAVLVRGVACDKNQAKVTVRAQQDVPGVVANLFRSLSESEINVDMILQNASSAGITDISFTVPQNDLVNVKDILLEYEATYDENIAKVSIVGIGMRSHTGVAYKAFQTLADSKVNIQMISTSEIKISVVISEDQNDLAVQALHTAFGLDAGGEGGIV